ncbi:hypothetical protein AB4K20DRAFT_1979325 [Rhizopus microsporus]|uniref:Uncharacterized protein n=1 Tax=Rhizopus microsporus TaxID=58291 RepID=A0A1X0S4H1_RHIZD|nr:hypothetical protein BCV71DRAFT_242990 [Rhizopus microsporus]
MLTFRVGPNAASLYLPRPTEWAGVQHTITIEFIDRLINYSLSVKKCFKAKPIVIVFGTHATRNEISMDFEPTTFEFAKGIPSKHWAEKCYILDKNTITEATKATPLPAMVALAYFFFLSKTILQTSTRIPAEKSVTEALLEVCDQKNKQFKKISNTLEPMPDTTCKRMYIGESDSLVEPMPSPPELSELAKSLVNQSSSNIDILCAEADLPKTDMEYVQQFKESEEKML